MFYKLCIGLLYELWQFVFRWIPEETGWVIDGFPTNLYQAKVLEKALTGFAAGDKKDDKASGKMKKSNLVKDPRPVPPAPDPASGLDVVINFEVPDDLCLKRSAGRLCKYPDEVCWPIV
jgi:adenylate kinase family enzyme